MKQLLILIPYCISIFGFSQTYKINQPFGDKTSTTFIYTHKKIDSRKPMTKHLGQETEILATFEYFGKNIKCTWTYIDTKAVIPDSLKHYLTPEWNELINIYKGIKVEFEINRNGKYLRLLNLNDCQKQIEDVSVKIYKNKNVKIDSASFAQIRKILKPTYENENKLIGTYFKEIFLYFNILGDTLENGMRIEAKSFSPNPFGGEEFPLIDRIEISDITDSTLTIEKNQTPLVKEFNRILKETMSNLSKQGNKPLKKDKIPDVDIISKTNYYYNLKKKQLSKVILNTVVTINGNTQSEILEVQIKN